MFEKLTKIWLLLLPIALLTSMAAMEFLSWTFFLIFLIHIILDLKKNGKYQVLELLKIKIDWAIWGYFFTVLVGALFVVQNQQLDVVGDARWILLLYAYGYILRKYLKLDWQKYITIVCWVTTVVGAISFLQFYFGWDFTRKREILAAFGQYYRASGLFNHPLTFAYSIGMVWLLLLAVAIENFKLRGRYFWISFISSFFALAGLITSLSRGAWAAGGIALIVLVFLSYKKVALKSVIALFLFGVGLYFTNSTIQSRFQDMATVSGNESNRLRTVLWRANWEIFKDHPIVGVGLSQNKNYLLKYYSRLGFQGENIVSHAHNNYLQILAGTGLIGFFFYMSFCIYFLMLSFFTYKKLETHQVFYRGLTIGIFSAQIFLHLGGLTQCNFTDGEVNHLLVFLWGVLLAISYQLRIKKPEAV